MVAANFYILNKLSKRKEIKTHEIWKAIGLALLIIVLSGLLCSFATFVMIELDKVVIN